MVASIQTLKMGKLRHSDTDIQSRSTFSFMTALPIQRGNATTAGSGFYNANISSIKIEPDILPCSTPLPCP